MRILAELRSWICEKGKLAGFEEKTEMANGAISFEEFTIKGGVLRLGGG